MFIRISVLIYRSELVRNLHKRVWPVTHQQQDFRVDGVALVIWWLPGKALQWRSAGLHTFSLQLPPCIPGVCFFFRIHISSWYKIVFLFLSLLMSEGSNKIFFLIKNQLLTFRKERKVPEIMLLRVRDTWITGVSGLRRSCAGRCGSMCWWDLLSTGRAAWCSPTGVGWAIIHYTCT